MTAPLPTYTLLLGGQPASPRLVNAVQEIEVDSSLEMASLLRLRVGIVQGTHGADWSTLRDDPFTPLRPITVRLALGDRPETLINGYVSGEQVTFHDEPGRSTLEVVAIDATLLMNLEEKVAAWPNLSDSEIASRILDGYSQHSLTADVHSTPGSLKDPEGTPTQRGTDMRFLRRLAQRHGFECFVQPTGQAVADSAYFGPPRLSGDYQAVLTVAGGTASNVSEYRVRYDMLRPTRATASGLLVATKATQPVSVTDTSLDALGRTGTLARLDPPPLLRPAQTSLVHSQELFAMAQAVVDRSTWALVAQGTVGPDVGILRPGRPIDVRGAGRAFSGSYYVTRVTHTIGGQGYIQRFEARRNAVLATGSEGYREDYQDGD